MPQTSSPGDRDRDRKKKKRSKDADDDDEDVVEIREKKRSADDVDDGRDRCPARNVACSTAGRCSFVVVVVVV